MPLADRLLGYALRLWPFGQTPFGQEAATASKPDQPSNDAMPSYLG